MRAFLSDLGLFILRAALGLFLLLAGWGKMLSEIENGVGTFYQNAFVSMQPGWLPKWFGLPYGYALPWLEVLIGGLLILGLFGRVVASIGALMLISFTIVYVIHAGHYTGLVPEERGVFHNNYIHSAGWLALALVGGGRWAFDSLLFGPRKAAV